MTRPEERPEDRPATVLLVTGAGRSGTSTVAGTLKLLGLHLPQPEVEADATNPRGFFESRWVVDFHKDLLNRNPIVKTIDARPEARGHGDELSVRPAEAALLDAWLGEQLAEAGPRDVLVKDPRAFWVHRMWRTAARDRGADVAFLTMLRHPVEVAKSRDNAYVSDRDDAFRRRRTIGNVAAWVNAAFVTEEVTREDRRAFVRYDDLLADWRAALGPAAATLGLHVDLGPAPSPVDDFIDVKLRTSQTSWDDADLPVELQRIADAVWHEMDRLVADPHDVGVVAALEPLRRDYARLHDDAVALALDHTNVREALTRRSARWYAVKESEERIAELERQLAEARAAADEGVAGLARRAVRRARRP